MPFGSPPKSPPTARFKIIFLAVVKLASDIDEFWVTVKYSIAIDVIANLIRVCTGVLVPFNGVGVEVGGKVHRIAAARGRIDMGRIEMSTAARPRIFLPMERAAYDRRLAAFVFHDVNLAAQRPLNLVRIQPERRPHALCRRQIDARFKPTLAIKRIRCNQARPVQLAGQRLIRGRDLKISVGNRHLFRPIILLFVVEAIFTIECRPIRRIESRAVELVVPEKLPPGDVWYLGGDPSRMRRTQGQHERYRNSSSRKI